MNELPLKYEVRSSIAMGIERLADRCIELRESLFKFSWRRLIPLPGFFEAIDYADLLYRGKTLTNDILEKKRQIESLLDEVKSANICSEDINFLKSCKNFCNDCYKELTALNTISRRLNEKVKDRSIYTKKQYNADVHTHEQLMVQTGSSYDQMANAYNSALSRF